MGRSGARYAQLSGPAQTFANFNVFTGASFTQVQWKNVSKIAAYPATSNDIVILCDATAGAFTVTLPFTGNAKTVWVIKKVDASANAVTVQGVTGNLDGGASLSLAAQNNSVIVTTDGTNGFVLGKV